LFAVLDPLQPFFGNSCAFAVMGDDSFELLDAVLDRTALLVLRNVLFTFPDWRVSFSGIYTEPSAFPMTRFTG